MTNTPKKEKSSLKNSINPEKLPGHVAVIMDGNGRWAKSHKLKRVMGHRSGMKSVNETVTTASEIGIKVLSLYAFSEENWQRPALEVGALMGILKEYVVGERGKMMDNNIKLIATGNLTRLPADVRAELDKTIAMTAGNTGLVLNLALSYSGRDEIIRAINRYLEDEEKKGSRGRIDQRIFSRYLDTHGLPDPDLLIRTSGEQRVSNFLLWQIAYAEIYVTDVLWPDFRKEDFYRAIVEFQKRERRFGLVSEQITGSNPIDISY